MFILLVHYPTGKDIHVPLTRDRYLVGSAPECDIVLDSPIVASQHLMLFVSPKTVDAVCLQSSDTVAHNGTPLQGRETLLFGDTLNRGRISAGCH